MQDISRKSSIREIAREILGFLLRFSGIYWLIREIFHGRRALILVYHDSSPGIFRKHVKFLKIRYNLIDLDLLVNALKDQDWGKIPRKALVVTFDDGHRGNADLLEVFIEQGLAPTLYVCSDIVGTNRGFWWLCTELDAAQLKQLPHEQFLARLKESGYVPDQERSERQSLDMEELQRLLLQAGIGAHTKTHPILPRCTDVKSAAEIKGAKEGLERMLGMEVGHFAYPDGAYTARERSYVRRAGYRSGRSLVAGLNGRRADRFALRATCVDDDASLNVLCGRICGVFPLVRRLFERKNGYGY